MVKDITLGQYFPGNSPIHRLDPRTKLLLALAFIVLTFLVKELVMFVPVILFVGAVVFIARLPLSYLLKSLKPMRFLIILMLLFNLFFVSSGRVLFEWKFIKLTTGGIEQSIFIVLRLLLLVSGTSLLTLTTTPVALTDGLERMLSPLAKIGFPAHDMAMMMTIALRFIPTLLEETERIIKAQTARGADFESGNIIKRARCMIPILVPLFVSSFRRADELAIAMESRCYHGGEGRTKMKVLKYSVNDLIAVLITAALIAGTVVLQGVLFA